MKFTNKWQKMSVLNIRNVYTSKNVYINKLPALGVKYCNAIYISIYLLKWCANFPVEFNWWKVNLVCANLIIQKYQIGTTKFL